jgi:hypothetical protein
MHGERRGTFMIDDEHARKMDELDRLLNDPNVSMQPERIWSLVADVSRRANTGGSGPRRSIREIGGHTGVRGQTFGV